MTDSTKYISNLAYGQDTYVIKDAEARTSLADKQDTLVSGTNIKTINSTSILGSGDITIQSGPTYTAGTGIDITNDAISVTSPTLVNRAPNVNNTIWVGEGRNPQTIGTGNVTIGNGDVDDYVGTNSVAVGYSASTYGAGGVAIGYNSSCNGTWSVAIGGNSSTQAKNFNIAIGPGAHSNANYAIQMGCSSNGGYSYNDDASTFKVANANGNFEIMSANGTIPTDRFTTTPSADGTYVPTLNISSGTATRSWSVPSSTTAVTATLATANWSSNSQTVNVTGVTASNNVIVAAAPSSQYIYASNGIKCSSQGTGTLTFTCETVPSSAITINVLIFG